MDRETGKLIVAEPYGPINWADSVNMETGRPVKNPKYGTTAGQNTEGICPAAIGFKDQQPVAYSHDTNLFYVPANNICMDYEGVEVSYAAGQPYVGAIVRMFPGPGGERGRFIAWDATTGEIAWEIPEDVGTYGGALATAGGVVFYGTLDGWLKAADAESGEVLWKFKTPSGIIGNPMTYMGPDGKQHVAILSGIGGWAGIGVAAGIGPEDPTAGLGALGAFGDLARHVNQAGILLDFTLDQGTGLTLYPRLWMLRSAGDGSYAVVRPWGKSSPSGTSCDSGYRDRTPPGCGTINEFRWTRLARRRAEASPAHRHPSHQPD